MLEKFFPHNSGTIDRVIRVVLGIGLLSIVFVGPHTMWGLLGLVPLLTAAIGSCPIYTLLGIGTCATKPQTPAKSS